MLCRSTGLPKDTIGAIRVQYQETFIEIATDSVAKMKAELGPELPLEQGAKLTELVGQPDFDSSPKGPPAEARSVSGSNKNRNQGPHKRSKPASETVPSEKAVPAEAKRSEEQGASAAKKSNSQPKFKKTKQKKSKKVANDPDHRKAKQKATNEGKDAPVSTKPAKTQKFRGNANKKSSKPPHSKGKTDKGGNARPFRKRSTKS